MSIFSPNDLTHGGDDAEPSTPQRGSDAPVHDKAPMRRNDAQAIDKLDDHNRGTEAAAAAQPRK